VVDVMRRRIRGGRLPKAIGRPDTREIAEVIIEGMILFHNHHDMLNRIRRLLRRGLRPARRNCTHHGTDRPNGHYRRINPQQSPAPIPGFRIPIDTLWTGPAARGVDACPNSRLNTRRHISTMCATFPPNRQTPDLAAGGPGNLMRPAPACSKGCTCTEAAWTAPPPRLSARLPSMGRPARTAGAHLPAAPLRVAAPRQREPRAAMGVRAWS
jgi:hypothetical protein